MDGNIELSVDIDELDSLFDEFPLAGRFDRDTNFIPIIIGLDLIQYLGPLQLVPLLHGLAFSVPTRLDPFGEVNKLHSPGPCQDENRECLAFDSVLTSTAEVKTSHLFFVLESRNTYLDPLKDFFPDSDVKRGLERIFKRGFTSF